MVRSEVSPHTRRGHRPWQSRRPFQSVLVMEPAQDRRRRDPMADRKTMAIRLFGHPLGSWIRNAGTEAGVWPAAIVMSDPFLKDSAKMPFTARDQPIQALSAHGADHAFAMRVRLRCSHGRLENRQTHSRDHSIDTFRIDAIAVVNDPSMGLIA